MKDTVATKRYVFYYYYYYIDNDLCSSSGILIWALLMSVALCYRERRRRHFLGMTAKTVQSSMLYVRDTNRQNNHINKWDTKYELSSVNAHSFEKKKRRVFFPHKSFHILYIFF